MTQRVLRRFNKPLQIYLTKLQGLLGPKRRVARDRHDNGPVTSLFAQTEIETRVCSYQRPSVDFFWPKWQSRDTCVVLNAELWSALCVRLCEMHVWDFHILSSSRNTIRVACSSLQSQHQVFEVHWCCWLGGGTNLHWTCCFIPNQATKTWKGKAGAQNMKGCHHV